MHPAIRIVLLVVFAATLPRLSVTDLGAACVGLAVAGLLAGRGAFRAVWRLRWLLAVILVLSWGFTPGDPLWPALPGLSRDGLLQGLRQSSLLLALALAVHLVLATSTPAGLARGLVWLAQPLRAAGCDPGRLARRLGGALQGIGAAGEDLRAVRAAGAGSLVQAAAQVIARIERQAAAAAAPIGLEPGPGPRWFEWLAPLGLAVLASLA